MLWYNNPEAVSAMHHHTMDERHEDLKRRNLLRLVGGGDPTERH
jgi:hypothetical protein